MANPTIDAVIQQVTATDTVIDSAVALIGGIKGQIDDAVQKALTGGATQQELQPLTDLSNTLGQKTQALADAVAANTPHQPTPPAPTPPQPGPQPAQATQHGQQAKKKP